MNKVDIFTTVLILLIVSFGIYICVKFNICEMFSVSGRLRNNNIQYILPEHIRNLNNQSQNSIDLQVPPKYEDVVCDENNINQEIDSDNDHRITRPISNPPGYGTIV